MTKGKRFKNFAAVSAFTAAIILGGAIESDAQSRRDNDRQRDRIEAQRQASVRQATRERNRERQTNRRHRQPTNSVEELSYYPGSQRSAENAAIQQGYEQGMIAGRSDGRARKYNRFNVYRNTGSAPNSDDLDSHAYLYRQGYLQGYEDGYNGRYRY